MAETSVRKEIIVEVPIEKAFRLFTEHFDAWWPREHHIGTADLKQAVIEPRVGGRWYEIGVDGSECDWGRVVTWDPPNTVVFTWQLTSEWKYDPDFITHVVAEFKAIGASSTLVSVEHRDLEKFGDKHEAMLASFGSDGGWNGLLKLFAAEAVK